MKKKARYVGDEATAPTTRTYYVNDKWQVVDGTTGEEIELPDNVRLPQYDEKGYRYAYTMVEQSITLKNPNYDPEGGNSQEYFEIKLDPKTGEPDTAENVNDQAAVEFYKSIFTDAKVTEGTFQATNVYNDEQNGRLAVEKWLNVGETKPESYPAIRVKLYRAVTSQATEGGEWTKVTTYTWDSGTVKEACTSGDGGWGRLLTHTFKDLPIYAPNGEKYVYKVVEVKENFLDGYATWAVKGTVEKGDLNEKTNKDNLGEVVSDLEAMKVTEGTETTPDTATFINKRDAGGVKLQGTKVWDDWNDELKLRPDNADDLPITLVVSRRADAQEGQGNAIPLQPLPEGSYEVKWNIPKDNGEPWTYTITGKDGGELERYAPNGMPWIYQVTETISDPYDYYNASTKTVTFGTELVDGVLIISETAKPITNSLKTSATFQKKWQGEDKAPISTDYFGDVTVEFKLQVSADGTEWKDITDFFTNDDTASDDKVCVSSNILDLSKEKTYQDSITAKMNAGDAAWKHTFSDLPRAVSVSGTATKLTYRVVETQVTYTLPGGTETTVDVTLNADGNGYGEVVDENGIFTGAELTSGATWITTNTMKTVDLEIRKIWEDQGNKYGTRPEGGSDGTWKVDFIIQYRDEGDGESEYTTVTTKNDEPLIVSITGGASANDGATTVEDLPYVEGRQYYAFELEPGYEDNVDTSPEDNKVYGSENQPGNYHNNMYGAVYDHEIAADNSGDCTSTVTNTLRTTQVTAVKEWKPAGKEPYPQVTLELRYVEKWLDDNTPELSEPIDTVVLDGTDGNWEYTWTGLPLRYPDDPSIETGETTYQVVELDGEGYVLVEGPEEGTDNEGYKTFTFTNKPVVDFTVTKQWNSVPAEAYNWKVTVGLYRTTEEDFDPTIAEEADFAVEFAVSDPDDSMKQYVLTLDSSNNYTDTFEDLDKYYMDETTGDCLEYTYYVKELKVDGVGIDGTSFTKVVDGEDVAFTVDYTYTENAATVVNRVEGSLQVKKVWHDKGGESARPAEITVGLYRFDKASQDYEVVKDPSNLEKNYTLTLDEENDWQGTFENLPEYYSDGNGNRGEKIQYAVYELENGTRIEQGGTLTATDDGSYTVHYDGFTIHNVREEALTIEKTVTGDAADPNRQFTFEVGFTYDEDMPAGSTGPYAYTVYDAKTKEPVEGGTDTIPSAGGTISLTGGQYAVIEGLPARTAYTVTEKEANEDGYVTTATGEEGTITVGEENKASFTNHRAPGDLVIQKQVTGSRGDRNEQWEFHLKADLLEGMLFVGDSVGYRNGDTEVKLLFDEVAGYATFTLKSGESLEIKDFPIGTVFTVTEEGANEDGYTTKVEGNGTAVPDGMEVKLEYDVTSTVTFINHKPGGGGPGPGLTPTPTPEPEETPTPEPGESPTPAPEGSPSPEPSGTPGPDGTPTPAPSGSPSPSGSPTPGPGGPPTPAPTPTPPGGGTPDDTPQTGDPTHTLWWALAGAGALAGLGALWATRPKGHKARHRKK